MEVDSDNELLTQVAAGGSMDSSAWPDLLADILQRLDKIAHDDFPIPKLPPPAKPTLPTDDQSRLISPLPSSPPEISLLDENKENTPAQKSSSVQQLEPGRLPKQIQDMLDFITAHLKTFETNPPHTIQRLAELILRPRAHYKALATYLHAVDRVVMVTSSVDIYPLPPAIPDMSSIDVDSDNKDDPAAQVAWSNPTSNTLGSDEALGGALLTPIPWLHAPKSKSESDGKGDAPGAQIHSESTETIDGPNGMGSIETVSVSVNGIPSTGHTRGITQGELLRQEQRAGVVPITQLSRSQEPLTEADRGERSVAAEHQNEDEDAEDEEEIQHARGPEEIGVNDTGKQKEGTTFTGENVDAHSMDVEAAVGRKHEETSTEDKDENAEDEEKDADESMSSPESQVHTPDSEISGTKREAEPGLEGEPARKQAKEEDPTEKPEAATSQKMAEDDGMMVKAEVEAKNGDQMDTGK